MATPVPEQIGELLGGISGRGAFAARRTARADDLHIEVKGIGRLRFPVSRAQARELCRVARPARYGRGEQTLQDERVRDTWEIPRSRVQIDRRLWNRTLLPVLDHLRVELGLPAGCKLKAELHGMLVYAPGQFFLPHQDSEKADEMVGTLVVTLPSSFKGGTFVIEHMGEKVTYRATKQPLTFIAFYADCHHEVRPVKEGYRIVLTYNLLLEVGAGGSSYATDPATVDALARRLREHFETPRPSPRRHQEGAPPREPPLRLVYLLDHQYTERGLGWERLKGTDRARVATLRAAAEQVGCELVLALAEVHETWDCEDEGWDEPWHARRGGWDRDEDDDWDADDDWYADDDPRADGSDGHTLVDLLDRSITLNRWIGPAEKKAEPILTEVREEEVCDITPSAALEPYASEYEGFMGNYGNTMDRWYRRAAVVLWPSGRAFVVRAEASPMWALETLRKRIRAGSDSEAKEMAESLLPFWRTVAMREERRGFLDKALSVAESLDAPDLATPLLEPFRVEALTPRQAPAFVALVKRYGEGWVGALLSHWSTPRDRRWDFEGEERHAWLSSKLPRICEALCRDDEHGTAAAKLLLEDQWGSLRDAIVETRGLLPPSRRDEALRDLARPILAFLEGVALAKDRDLRHQAVTFLCADENERLLPCLVSILRTASESMSPGVKVAFGLDVVQQRCVRLLEKRLAVPARDKDDWSIAGPKGCGCKLCGTLTDFLAARDRSRLDWPLAEKGREHIHRMLDTHELPVRHETRRWGSPYTLVLTKTDELFGREAAERRSWKADLERVRGSHERAGKS